MAINEWQKRRAREYLVRARQVLKTGWLALEHEDYITAVNRAYYAFFYAANALLTTKGLERSKHSGVIAAFREHFVKTGIIEVEYGDRYGSAMEDRHLGDYTLEPLSYDTAKRDLEWAEKFVDRVEEVLKDMGV